MRATIDSDVIRVSTNYFQRRVRINRSKIKNEIRQKLNAEQSNKIRSVKQMKKEEWGQFIHKSSTREIKKKTKQK